MSQPSDVSPATDPRLAALRRTGLLDTPPEPAFDRLTRLASAILRAPIALVALVDEGRDFVKSHVGLPEPWATSRVIDITPTFCQVVVGRGALVAVENAPASSEFACFPAVDGIGVRAYLGVPLRAADGHALGSVCVIDVVPRTWSAADREALLDLASAAATEIELRAEVAERRRAEAALRRSEARLAEAQRVGRIGSWELDLATGAVHWSAELFGLVGLEPREGGLTLEEFFTTVHPDDRAPFREMLDEHLATGEPYEFLYRTRHPDGTIRWLCGRGEPAPAEGEAPARLVGTAQDMTERVLTEQALRGSEARFRQLAEHAPIGVFLADRTGRAIYHNAHIGRVTGRARTDMLGESWLDGLHPDDRPRVIAGYMAYIADVAREAHRDEFRLIRPDGEERIVVAHAARLLSPTGGTEGFVGALTDVTRTRTAEQALRASEARFRALIENASDMIAVLDADGVYTYVSPAHARFIGFDAGDLLGHSAFELMHPENLRETRDAFARVVASPGTTTSVRFRYRHKDGDFRTLATVATNLLQEPAIGGVVLNSHDITEQTELEGQLRQAQKMEAVGRLAGGVAHDFNNLLMVIGSHARFALDALPPLSPVREEIEAIDEASRRAATLTRQLLAFSRKQILKPEVLELNTVVRGLEPMLRRLIGEDITVRTRLAPRLGMVLADPMQVEQVLVNLALNARDAMAGGGRLTIETANVEICPACARTGLAPADDALPAGRYVRLTVRDTGAGMDAETQARVFEPFFTTKEPGKGTGLGLATVYGIVRQSGGAVRVSSAPGEGTTFEIDLPRAAACASPGADGVDAAPSGHGTETVLLVEDEPQVRAIVRRLLSRRGYTVLEAANGNEALRIAAEDAGAGIALVVTDMVMPEMSGRDFADRLAARRPDVRVLFMSGYTNDEIIRRGLLRPGMAFLEKPFSSERLLAAVREALEVHS